MSRLATLPDAQRIELIERVAEHVDRIVPLEGGAWIDVAAARAIYVVGTNVVVEVDAMQFRFVMADEPAACDGARKLAHISLVGGQ